MLGPKDKKLESVALNQNHFENFARDLLIVKHYCIEIYSNSKGNKNDWTIQYTASPGNLTQVEELIFGSADITTLTGILAVKTGENNTVGCCFIDTNERKFLVSQFSDTESFINLEALVVQLSPKVYLTSYFIFKIKSPCLLLKEVLIPIGEGYESAKIMFKRYNLLVNESKKAEFQSTEAVRVLNRLLRFKKGQQENAAALPEAELVHSMASLAALAKQLDVKHLLLLPCTSNYFFSV